MHVTEAALRSGGSAASMRHKVQVLRCSYVVQVTLIDKSRAQHEVMTINIYTFSPHDTSLFLIFEFQIV